MFQLYDLRLGRSHQRMLLDSIQTSGDPQACAHDIVPMKSAFRLAAPDVERKTPTIDCRVRKEELAALR